MIDEYLESKVTTATPYQLHLMVIDGAMRHARAAQAALEQKNVREARARLAQSRQFVAEILSGLDEKRMAEVVVRLNAIFVFVLRSLASALGNIGPPAVSALPALEQVLKINRVRWAAQEAILKIKGEPVPLWY